MAEWREEKPTMRLRIRLVRYKNSDATNVAVERILQQMWEVVEGGAGDGVKYTEEWRDVPVAYGE